MKIEAVRIQDNRRLVIVKQLFTSCVDQGHGVEDLSVIATVIEELNRLKGA